MILSDRTLFKMLEAGRGVGQLVFAEMDDTALKPYNGKYQGRRVPPGRGYIWTDGRAGLQAKRRSAWNCCVYDNT